MKQTHTFTILRTFLLTTLTLLFTLSPAQAQTIPTIQDFKTSYEDMIDHHQYARHIQLKSGHLVLSEFDRISNNVYGGHLGSFWSSPYFSSHSYSGEEGDDEEHHNPFNGFNHVLAFYSITHQGGGPEQSTQHQNAYWYPSKLTHFHNYPGAQGGTDVQTVKTTIPGQRGFALKVTVTNKSPTPNKLRLLFLGDLPNIAKLETWPQDQFGWNWLTYPSTNSNISSFGFSNNIITVGHSNLNAYLSAGISAPALSWQISSDRMDVYNNFITEEEDKPAGTLPNTNQEGLGPKAFGLVADLPELQQNQSHTITLVIGLGDSQQAASSIVTNYRQQNVESLSDNFWNTRLSNFYSQIPRFNSGNQDLNHIYRNSALTYLLNRWPLLDGIGQASSFSQSTSIFPWLTGTTAALTHLDSNFWRQTLVKLMNFDYGNCRAYDFVSGIHLCDNHYSHSPYSLVQAVYDYVTITGDTSLLSQTVSTPSGSQTVFNFIRSLITHDWDRRDTSDGLVDFGNDRNMYEFNIHCTLGGRYTGKVVSPNAERVIAHRQLSKLASYLGHQSIASTELQRSQNAYNSLQNLWNPSANWFDSISHYDSNGNPRSEPFTNTFRTIIPYLLLHHDNLLTEQQITTLTSRLHSSTGGFIGSHGLTSLPIGQTWCSRADWHGPGLYSGAAGAVITGLFNQGLANQAYSIMFPTGSTGYSYLSTVPYFSQSFPHNQPQRRMVTSYIEGISFVESIIKGMFGVKPHIDRLNFEPSIPQTLTNLGQITLTHLRVQQHRVAFNITSPIQQALDINVNFHKSGQPRATDFIFNYSLEGSLNLTAHNLQTNTSYAVKTINLDDNQTHTTYTTTNSQGRLTSNLNLSGRSSIELSPGTAPSPTPTSTPANTPTPTPIPLPSYSELITNFNKQIPDITTPTSDINNDGVVNIFDYSLWVYHKSN